MKIISGMIVIWYGTSGTIPDGYHICDGNNGTPNFRDRLPFCGDFVQAPGAVAGSWHHSHIGSTYIHNHTFDYGPDISYGDEIHFILSDANPSTSLNTVLNVPPTLALHYIQKA